MKLHNYMIRIMLLTNIFVFSCQGFEGLQILTPDDLTNSPQIEVDLKVLYLRAFKEVYSDHWSAKLEAMIHEGFDTYITKFKHSNDMVLVVAMKDGAIMGWALFYKDQQRTILELISIDPQHWRKGIGKKLVLSIKEFCPEISNISVVTRKINALSPLFYESIGFCKTKNLSQN